MRIYINSRMRDPSSLSTSDFRVTLPRPVEFPEGAQAYVDSITLSHTFPTIVAGQNDRLYVDFHSGGIRAPRHVDIPSGTYTVLSLASAVQSAINAQKPDAASTVTVTAIGNRLSITATGLSAPDRVQIWAREQLRRGENPDIPLPITFDLRDASAVVGVNTGTFEANLQGGITTQFCNMQLYKQIYLHSSNLGECNSHAPDGSQTCIAAISVGNTVAGDVISSHHQGLTAASLALPSFLDSIHVQLKSADGRVIDLDGHDVCFTLVTSN